MEQIHEELTRKEMARLEAIKAVVNDDENMKLLDDGLFSDEPVDLNHLINSRSEEISVQA
jgi:hypothetical protein